MTKLSTKPFSQLNGVPSPFGGWMPGVSPSVAVSRHFTALVDFHSGRFFDVPSSASYSFVFNPSIQDHSLEGVMPSYMSTVGYFTLFFKYYFSFSEA